MAIMSDGKIRMSNMLDMDNFQLPIDVSLYYLHLT